MKTDENARKETAPKALFWESVIARSLSQSRSSEPRLAPEEDERTWDKAFERAFLPRRLKRIEEEIRKMNLKRIPALSPRDEKILRVIQMGSKGLQYCRELHNAGVKPRRAWIKDECPGTYPAAYLDLKWRQRINDEKSKIRHKSESAKLSRE